ECEGPVLVDRDDHRNRRALLELLRLRVERLAELHDVETALTERGADRRRGICGPRRHLQFEIAGNFLCHISLLAAQRSRCAGFVVRIGIRLAGWPLPPTTIERLRSARHDAFDN